MFKWRFDGAWCVWKWISRQPSYKISCLENLGKIGKRFPDRSDNIFLLENLSKTSQETVHSNRVGPDIRNTPRYLHEVTHSIESSHLVTSLVNIVGCCQLKLDDRYEYNWIFFSSYLNWTARLLKQIETAMDGASNRMLSVCDIMLTPVSSR